MPDTDTLAALLHLRCIAHINGERAWCEREATRLHAAGVRVEDKGLQGLYEHLFGAATLVIENNYAPDPTIEYDMARWNELVASVDALRTALDTPKEANRE